VTPQPSARRPARHPRQAPVSTLVLVRHGRTAANVSGTLAGWTPGVDLDEKGQAQAQALAARLAPVPLAAVVTSPLERCRQTAAALLAERDRTPEHVDDRFGEVRYGDWTGGVLKDLAKQPLWRSVQSHPSSVTFPGADGESMRAMQQRAVDAVREWNERLGPGATWVAVSHGDVIKAVLADALGLHLDQFQRIQVDPCSVSVVRYTELRPFVVRMNDTGGGVDALLPARGRGRKAPGSGDAVVGGGAGP
jgi:probable phosphomutase (TIGR03848 family)